MDDLVEYQRSNVDDWTVDELSEWIERHDINAEGIESEHELRMLVQSRLERNHAEASSEVDDRNSARALIGDTLATDRRKRRDLILLYEDVKAFNSEFANEVNLESIFSNLVRNINENISNLEDRECTIVVAGEVSSGKSSLLNLLLGEIIFPTAHIACSSTICRLHNSPRKAVEVIIDGQVHRTFENIRNVSELQQRMRKFAVHDRESEENPCQQLDIFWPVSLLPENVLLVDVPGVGESPDMDRMVLDYLSKSLVCVYVLFSANAGGVQEDKLQMILRERIRSAQLFAREYAFENTLFVCNYWDVVRDSGQEDDVWTFIVSRLESLIPNLDRSNVVKMSIKETSRYLDLGLGKTDYFKTLMEKFRLLMLKALSAKTLHHFRIQNQLLQNIEVYLASRRNMAALSREEKVQKIAETQQRLDAILRQSDEIRNKLDRFSREEVNRLGKLLHAHIHEKDSKERLLNCKDERETISQLKKGSKVQAYVIEQRVLNKLQNFITEWEKENQMFAKLQRTIKQELEQFLTDISQKLRRINLDLAGSSGAENLSVLARVPGTIRSGDIPLSTGGKVAIAVSAPIWVPLALAGVIVGVVIGLPIALAAHGIKRFFICGKYSDNEFQHRMYHHMESLLEKCLTEGNVTAYLVQTYYKGMSEQIVTLIDQNVKMEADAKMRELAIFSKDCHDAERALRVINVAKPKLDQLLSHFRIYELVYVSDDHVVDNRLYIGDYIGGGQFSDVYNATIEGNQVAVKVLKRPMLPETIYEQLLELDTIRILRHENIVKYIGVHVYRREHGEQSVAYTQPSDADPIWMNVYGSRLSFVLELCDDSLENRVFRTFKIQERLTDVNRGDALRFFKMTVEGICNALVYMHGRGYMHRDLKVSNVLLKGNVPRIADFGLSRLHALSHGTIAGTPTHMSPEMLSHKQYTSSTDIYSLGILMWEMWYGRHAYTEEIYANMDILTFVNAVVTGSRPNIAAPTQMQAMLGNLVTACWDGEAGRRPPAESVLVRIRNVC